MTHAGRRIGPIGTSTRLFAAAGLLYIAAFDGTSLGVTWFDAALGLGGLPGVMLAFGLVARRRRAGPIRFTGEAGLALHCVVIVALATNPVTASGAALFYGVTLVIAAGVGQPGCEATVLSNVILRRDDQIGCPVFTPVDEAERRIGERRSDGAPRPEGRVPG